MSDTEVLNYKVQALLESLSENTKNYENRVAELRVEVTLLTNQNRELRDALNSQTGNGDDPEVVEGTVV